MDVNGLVGDANAWPSPNHQLFPHAIGEAPLSGLILTGAPVEELAFEAVHYWQELSRILEFLRRNLRSTLGLCWGGLALVKLLGR
jgi:homoserine O-succinyltransferase